MPVPSDGGYTSVTDKEVMMRAFERSAIGGLALAAMLATACGTLTGAAVGAGTGAAVGYGTGYGAGKGALIGTGVGAAAGAVYDIYKHESSQDKPESGRK